MKTCRFLCAGLACLLVGLVGCGANYTITFQVGDVINDGDKGPAGQEQLAVDIVCVTKDDAEDFPELVEGTWRSKDWFDAKDKGDHRVRRLHERIYALRYGKDSQNDVWKGAQLVSVSNGGPRERVVKDVRHPNVWHREAAVVIFGRFHDGGGNLAKTPPVLIRPLPWNKNIKIAVGRQRMEWVNDR